MVGQKKILNKISRWQEPPRFMIFHGTKGCGKKTLAKEIANKFNMQLILINYKIDDIREMIKLAKEYDTSILFLIDDGNKMSIGAENTLLKVTEEAPNNVHIILSVENKDILLPTIISRGECFNFTDYSLAEYNEYLLLKGKDKIDDELRTAYPNLSYLDIFNIDEAKRLVEFCKKILLRIREANGANAFKILEKIKIKEEQEGYEIRQFLYCLKNNCINTLFEAKDLEYSYQLDYLKIIMQVEKMLSNPLFNKSYILDKLILDFKAVYY